MKTNRFLQGLLGLIATFSVSAVCALPIAGEIEFGGIFAAGSDESVSGLQRARVTFASGDFASLVSVGDTVDFSGVDLLQQPATWSLNDLSFALLTAVLADVSNDPQIDLTGEGSVSALSGDQANFIWSFSETQFLPTVSLFTLRIEAREPVTVTEPSLIVLMTVGLIGLLIGRKRSY